MLGSILSGFDFVVAVFTPPAAAPATPAAALEGLAGAPCGVEPHRHVKCVVVFAPNMLCSATQRSSERCADSVIFRGSQVPDYHNDRD